MISIISMNLLHSSDGEIKIYTRSIFNGYYALTDPHAPHLTVIDNVQANEWTILYPLLH